MIYKKSYESNPACGIKYKVLRKMCLGNAVFRHFFYSYINRIEGGQFYSQTLRKIYKEVFDIQAGIATYGCFTSNFRPHVRIGNYCSIAPGVQCLVGNHPITDVSTHPVFHKKEFGLCENTRYTDHFRSIGDDVWIGVNAIITASCETIGTGAVIGGGAVVTADVPPYAVVAGVPARVIKYRFDEETRQKLLSSGWWDLKLDELEPIVRYADDIDKFVLGVKKIWAEKEVQGDGGKAAVK